MSVLAVIHARGGSKRIPLKNIRDLGGKPLIAWMVQAALACPELDRVIVSTDHPDIARIAREFGAEVPFTRPAALAEDVPSEMVTAHAVRFVEEEEKRQVEIAVTLQPTTPFCAPEDIGACVRMLRESEFDAVVTMREVRERPEWMFAIENHAARSFTGLQVQGETGVWQSLRKLYTPNGAAYATRRAVLMEQHSIFGQKTGAVTVPIERSHDIDEPIDFVIAEGLLESVRAAASDEKA